LEVIWQENSACVVELIGLELNPEVPKAAIRQNIFNDWDDQYRKILTELAFKHYL
jgi:hypothetical protein